MTARRHHPLRARSIALALLLAPLPGVAGANAPADLRQLFPQRATLQAQGSGLCRLEPSAELLAACRPDLADLRIFDAAGRELPFVVDTLDRSTERLAVAHSVRARVSDVERHEEPSEGAPSRFVEVYRLAVPALPDDAAAWDLIVNPARAHFAARLELIAVARGGGSRTLLEEGSLFRIVSPAAERTRVPLAVDPGQLDYLELHLTSAEGGFLEPELSFAAQRLLPAREDAELWLETSSIHSANGETVVLVHRPRGLVPSSLRLVSSTGSFSREVTVWDAGAGAVDSPLARAFLFRIDAIAPIEQLQLQLLPARGDRLRVQIADHDSPPLEKLRVAALIHRPVVYFSLPDRQLEATIYFGGGRAHRPQYDLASLLPPSSLPISGEAAQLAMPFLDPAQSTRVLMSEASDNPLFDPRPALAFAMRAGALLDDVASYGSRRVLDVQPSPEGLSRLRLDAADLAATQADLADVRVVDDDNHQWAYLLEEDAGEEDLQLELSRKSEHGRSTYELAFPYSTLVAQLLELEIAAEFFDRSFSLEGDDHVDRGRHLAGGRLARRQGDPRALSLSFPTTRLTGLRLVVVDGDDAPLDIVRASVRVARPELYLTAQAGTYQLLLGNPQARHPAYELERVRATVLAVPAAEISAGALEDNPQFSTGARLFSSRGAQQTALWMVLGIAVVILAVLSFRLARRDAVD